MKSLKEVNNALSNINETLEEFRKILIRKQEKRALKGIILEKIGNDKYCIYRG